MKDFEVGLTGLIIFSAICAPFYITIIIIIITVMLVRLKQSLSVKRPTNLEVSTKGTLVKVDGACQNTITYLFEYKKNNYLLTYVGDIHLLNPDNIAFKI